MTRILIDTMELGAVASGIRRELAGLADLSLGLSRSWAGVGDLDPELAGLTGQAAAVQAGLDRVGEQFDGVARAIDEQVHLVQDRDPGRSIYALLAPLLVGGWLRTLSTPSGAAPNPTFTALASGASPFGTTNTPQLNALLGQAGAAPSLLAPYVSPGGGDLNAQALAISANIGVANALNGTGPLYANGALAGMSNSLRGIGFPMSGGTIEWAKHLQATHDARVAAGIHAPSGGGSGIHADPNHYAARGRDGALLIHPNSPSWGIMPNPMS